MVEYVQLTKGDKGMLRLDKVSKFYSSNGVVSAGFSKVSLDFHIGEFVAITGESGSGKSTLLNVISGLDSYEEGEMYIFGKPTSGYSNQDKEDYRKKYIGNIYQTFNLINSYTVYQNVELVLLLSGYKKDEIKDKVRDIIRRVGLEKYEKTKASKLSGGQKQRVAIARALAKETPIIVADEPTGNLDTASAADIMALLHEISKDKLVIIVTHNYEQVEQYVTRKITMYDGHVAEDRVFKEVDEDSVSENKIETARDGNLSPGNTVRLGLRNTFNIPAKLILLLGVLLFLCLGTFGAYASFKNMENVANNVVFSPVFNDVSPERILVTKPDKSAFTEEDFAKLKSIPNVETVDKNDIIRDVVIDMSKGDSINLSGAPMNSSQVSKFKEGKLPEGPDEAVIIFNGDDRSLNDQVKNIYGQEMEISDNNTPGSKRKIKITGYGYTTEAQKKLLASTSHFKSCFFAFDDEGMKVLSSNALAQNTSYEYTAGNSIIGDGGSGGLMYPLIPSEYVPEGEVYIPEELSMYYNNGIAKGKDFGIKVMNKYFSQSYDLEVGAVYNKDNAKRLLGVTNFEEMTSGIYVNPGFIKDIFDRPSYQCDAILKNSVDAEKTVAAIKDAGFDPLNVNKAAASTGETARTVVNTFRTVILIGLLVVMYFITYFIIKLIFKSRNIYFSTVRMLGGSKKTNSWLLGIEIFTVLNMAYFICLGIISWLKARASGVTGGTLSFFENITMYIHGGDFVIVYILLLVMTCLLSLRYASQMFSKSAMSSYREEV